MSAVAVRLRRSSIGCDERQRACLRGLGLRRVGDVRTLPNTPAVRGMAKRVLHLVDVLEVRDGE